MKHEHLPKNLRQHPKNHDIVIKYHGSNQFNVNCLDCVKKLTDHPLTKAQAWLARKEGYRINSETSIKLSVKDIKQLVEWMEMTKSEASVEIEKILLAQEYYDG